MFLFSTRSLLISFSLHLSLPYFLHFFLLSSPFHSRVPLFYSLSSHFLFLPFLLFSTLLFSLFTFSSLLFFFLLFLPSLTFSPLLFSPLLTSSYLPFSSLIVACGRIPEPCVRHNQVVYDLSLIRNIWRDNQVTDCKQKPKILFSFSIFNHSSFLFLISCYFPRSFFCCFCSCSCLYNYCQCYHHTNFYSCPVLPSLFLHPPPHLYQYLYPVLFSVLFTAAASCCPAVLVWGQAVLCWACSRLGLCGSCSDGE